MIGKFSKKSVSLILVSLVFSSGYLYLFVSGLPDIQPPEAVRSQISSLEAQVEDAKLLPGVAPIEHTALMFQSVANHHSVRQQPKLSPGTSSDHYKGSLTSWHGTLEGDIEDVFKLVRNLEDEPVMFFGLTFNNERLVHLDYSIIGEDS